MNDRKKIKSLVFDIVDEWIGETLDQGRANIQVPSYSV